MFSTFADTISDLHDGSPSRRHAPDGKPAVGLPGPHRQSDQGQKTGIDQEARARTLAGFAPETAGHLDSEGRTRSENRYDLLLTTDVLSEGVNLQQADASSTTTCPGTPCGWSNATDASTASEQARPVMLGWFFPARPPRHPAVLEETTSAQTRLRRGGRRIGHVLPGQQAGGRQLDFYDTREQIKKLYQENPELRDAESRALQAAIARLRDGVGGIVTVVGEAGIGKSRLVAEARKLAAESPRSLASASDPQSAKLTSPSPQSLRWIEGRCLSYATHVAYQVWADVLRGLLGLDAGASPEAAAETLRKEVGALCGAQAGEVHPFLARMISLPLDHSARERLSGIESEGLHVLTFRAVEMLLERAAEQIPLAVVCEDLHWADATSVELLLRLLSLTERAPILWICVFRPETEHGCWQIKEIAARHYAHRYTDLWLGPLSAGESAQVVGYLLRIKDLPVALRSRVLDRAEGNPFYVEETLRALIDEGALAFDPRSERWRVVREWSEFALPGTLRAVLAARIDRLSRGTRQVLQLASVLGRRFGRRELEAICTPLSGPGDESAPSRRGEGLGVGKAIRGAPRRPPTHADDPRAEPGAGSDLHVQAPVDSGGCLRRLAAAESARSASPRSRGVGTALSRAY